MNARVAIAVLTLLLHGPEDAAGQERSNVSVQGAVGGLVNVPGNGQAISVGFWPGGRVGILIGVDRIYMPTEGTRHAGGFSATRGGTTTFVSGEIRVLPLGVDQVSPYAVAGAGRRGIASQRERHLSRAGHEQRWAALRGRLDPRASQQPSQHVRGLAFRTSGRANGVRGVLVRAGAGRTRLAILTRDVGGRPAVRLPNER